MTDDLFLKYRIQHALHSSFYIFNRLIDNFIQTYIYLLTLCNGFCSRIRTYIKTNDDGIGSEAEETSDSLMAPTPPWITFTTTSSLDSLVKLCFTASTEPWTSALMIERKFLYISCLDLAEQVIQGQFCLSVFQKLILALRNEGLSKASCLFSLSVATNTSPACGTSFKPKISTGVDGPASLLCGPCHPSLHGSLP